MNIHIIVGPPCAGKSTHILGASKEGDVLIDFDTIAIAIGANEPHASDGDIKEIALEMRQSAIDKILKGLDATAWIIHTNPSSKTIKTYVNNDAVFTVLDPGIDECKKRATDDNRPDGTIEAIEKWYSSQPEIPEECLISPDLKSFHKLKSATRILVGV